jgi:hypothetical protein
VLLPLHPRLENDAALASGVLGLGLTYESADTASAASSKRIVDLAPGLFRHPLTLPVRAAPISSQIGTHSPAGQQAVATPQRRKGWPQ